MTRSPVARARATALGAAIACALAAHVAAAQDSTCRRGAAPPLVLARPLLASTDTVTLLRGELVANAAEGRGSLTIEYDAHAASADTARLARQAAALARAIAPLAGSVPYGVLTLRACRARPGRDPILVATFTFAQGPGGEWRPVTP